jgi:hypothetical protein
LLPDPRELRVAVPADEVVYRVGMDFDVGAETETGQLAFAEEVVNLSTRTPELLRNLVRKKDFAVHRT